MTTTLTPEQEAITHKLDTAGLAMLGAGVLGGVMQRHSVPRGAMHELGTAMHNAGPYLDLAGLALIAPPVMHGIARRMAPEKPKLAPGEIPVAGEPAEHVAATPSEQQSLEAQQLEAQQLLQAEHAKIASYALGARAARMRHGLHR